MEGRKSLPEMKLVVSGPGELWADRDPPMNLSSALSGLLIKPQAEKDGRRVREGPKQ